MGPTKVRNRNFEDVDSSELKDFTSDALNNDVFTVIHTPHGDIMIGPEWPLGFAENEGMTGFIEVVE